MDDSERFGNDSQDTVRLLIHVLRQPTFFFASLLSAVSAYVNI